MVETQRRVRTRSPAQSPITTFNPSNRNAAPAIDRYHLPGDVGSVGDQEFYRGGDILRLPDPFQRRLVDDALARDLVAPRFVVGPEDRAWRHPVHADLGREI